VMRKETHTSSQQVQPNTLRHPLRNGLRLIRALPGVPGSLASVACDFVIANLTPASGCQDHAISPSASRAARRAAATRPSHPRSAFVTSGRNAPLVGAGWARDNHIITKNGRGIFCTEGLDKHSD